MNLRSLLMIATLAFLPSWLRAQSPATSSKAVVDTLRVYESDTLHFTQKETFRRSRRGRMQPAHYYEWKNPQVGAYYYVYNSQKQLAYEGLFESKMVYEGQPPSLGIYTQKSYHYRKDGSLDHIIYMQDGRHERTEFFNRHKALTRINYYDAKTTNITKESYYRNGELIKTKNYTGFNQYTVER